MPTKESFSESIETGNWSLHIFTMVSYYYKITKVSFFLQFTVLTVEIKYEKKFVVHSNEHKMYIKSAILNTLKMPLRTLS